jgi:hypothetical protein
MNQILNRKENIGNGTMKISLRCLKDLNKSIYALTSIVESRYETTNISITDSVTQHACGTLYPAKTAGSPLGYADCPSDDDFIDLSRELHKRCLETKEENMLISPAIFDPKEMPRV